MRFGAIVHCSKCQEPIISGEGLSSVRFKIPSKNDYQFFHNRNRAGDCWGRYLKEHKHK